VGFNPTSNGGFDPDAARRERRATCAFDSDLAPIVGQQITLNQDWLRTRASSPCRGAIITYRRAP
jgi:hypothetical protein